MLLLQPLLLLQSNPFLMALEKGCILGCGLFFSFCEGLNYDD